MTNTVKLEIEMALHILVNITAYEYIQVTEATNKEIKKHGHKS
jgi:hypothetical protein